MNRLTAGLLCAASLALTLSLGGSATAQLAQGKGPIDVTANELEVVDAQHLAIWKGDVDAIQGQNRLRADLLNIYYTGKPGAGGQPAKAGSPGGNWGKVDHMIAEGHVYFVSPTQNARGDHAVYELGPDIITMTGDVIIEQGESVIHGAKLVIDVRTGHATMASDGESRTPSGRVRGVFYPTETDKGGSGPAAGRPQ
ncbi:MAG TPA: LptA/OstA family protein [Caulobacteraceae bacterium]